MSTFDIMNEVEDQACQIELSLAVLSEISDYFSRPDEFKLLPHHAEHISNLLSAATSLAYNTIPKFEKAVDALQEKVKEERNGKAN